MRNRDLRVQVSKDLKLLANSGEPTDLVPATIDPREGAVALRTVPAEVRTTAKAVQAPPHGPEEDDREFALDVGIFLTESQTFL